MSKAKFLKLSLIAAAVWSAQPALGDPYNFADFSVAGGGPNFYFRNDASSRSATFFTISDPAATNFGASPVNFNFMQSTLALKMGTVAAFLWLNGRVEDTAAQVDGVDLVQSALNGSFSFRTASDMTLFGRFYGAGANLLSGTLTAARLSGPRLGDTASLLSQGIASDYTSDFISFAAAANTGALLSLTSLTPALQASPESGLPANALRSFGAVASGLFSSDGEPIIDAVPEPQSWMLAIIGFALVGLQLRHKHTPVAFRPV